MLSKSCVILMVESSVKTYHHKIDIEREQVGILSMLRREFADVSTSNRVGKLGVD